MVINGLQINKYKIGCRYDILIESMRAKSIDNPYTFGQNVPKKVTNLRDLGVLFNETFEFYCQVFDVFQVKADVSRKNTQTT